jgi:hypothetical protein
MYQYPIEPEMQALAASAVFKRRANGALEPSTVSAKNSPWLE